MKNQAELSEGQRGQFLSIIQNYVTEERLKQYLSDLDLDRFGFSNIDWNEPNLDQLIDIGVPLAAAIQREADQNQRDFTEDEVSF